MEACELLLRAVVKTLATALAESEAADSGVAALAALEQCMMPLFRLLHEHHSEKRHEQAIDLVDAVLPVILAPLEPERAPSRALASARGAAAEGAPAADLGSPDRLACASLRVLLQVVAHAPATRTWRDPVGRLCASATFFLRLTRTTLPLWARVANAWLGLETPKAAVGSLLTGKGGRTVGWFASAAADADAHADQLRRLSFALWVGEHNQYVGALQGMLIDRVVAGFKYGAADRRLERTRAAVQVEALLCTRVLSVRVAAEHLTALWPIAMAELQRVLLAPLEARPALLLAACQLVDTLLAVLPDTFSPFGWMFVPDGAITSAQDYDDAIGPQHGAQLAAAEEVNGSSCAPLAPLPPPTPPTLAAEHAHDDAPGAQWPTADSFAEAASWARHGAEARQAEARRAEAIRGHQRRLLEARRAQDDAIAAKAAAAITAASSALYNTRLEGDGADEGGRRWDALDAEPSSVRSSHSSLPASDFAALLEPLAHLAAPCAAPYDAHATAAATAAAMADTATTPPSRGLLRPSADGRRRPLLGMRCLSHASELAPFASQLHRHLAASALLPRCAEVDLPLLEVLLGCEFVSSTEAAAMLAPHLLST